MTLQRHRAALDIVQDLLCRCRELRTQWQLSQTFKGNYGMVGKYLPSLVERGLVSKHEKYYLITERGRSLLQLLQEEVG
jgi:predicted transcriptional regulator